MWNKMILLCGLLALAACADPVPAPTNSTGNNAGNVQDCQRANDSEPCK